MNEELERKAFEHDKQMHFIRMQEAKELGWCLHCAGTGFLSQWVTNDNTRKFYGNVPQEFTMTCPYCNGTGQDR